MVLINAVTDLAWPSGTVYYNDTYIGTNVACRGQVDLMGAVARIRLSFIGGSTPHLPESDYACGVHIHVDKSNGQYADFDSGNHAMLASTSCAFSKAQVTHVQLQYRINYGAFYYYEDFN